MTRRNQVIANLSFWEHVHVEFWPSPAFDDPGALRLLYLTEKFTFGTDLSGCDVTSVLFCDMNSPILHGGNCG